MFIAPMPSPKIIQLRQAVADRFPHSRPPWDRPGASALGGWATGLPQIDESPWRGLPKGALTELCVAHKTTGSGTVLRALMERAAGEQRIVTFVDGSDSLDVTQMNPQTLSRLLWVRTRSAEQAIKAADLVLRDANLSFVILDLALNDPVQLRRIPATVWYRFQRLLENTATVCVVTTPQRMVLSAQLRLNLWGKFSLSSLESDRAQVLAEVESDVAESTPLADTSQQIA
jgi:hypothetical protein